MDDALISISHIQTTWSSESRQPPYAVLFEGGGCLLVPSKPDEDYRVHLSLRKFQVYRAGYQAEWASTVDLVYGECSVLTMRPDGSDHTFQQLDAPATIEIPKRSICTFIVLSSEARLCEMAQRPTKDCLGGFVKKPELVMPLLRDHPRLQGAEFKFI